MQRFYQKKMQQNEKGNTVYEERPIHHSNVQLYSNAQGVVSRVGKQCAPGRMQTSVPECWVLCCAASSPQPGRQPCVMPDAAQFCTAEHVPGICSCLLACLSHDFMHALTACHPVQHALLCQLLTQVVGHASLQHACVCAASWRMAPRSGISRRQGRSLAGSMRARCASCGSSVCKQAELLASHPKAELAEDMMHFAAG